MKTVEPSARPPKAARNMRANHRSAWERRKKVLLEAAGYLSLLLVVVQALLHKAWDVWLDVLKFFGK